MHRQTYQARFGFPIGVVFDGLVRVLARSRWAAEPSLTPVDRPPATGCAYVHKGESFARRGKVVECLPPVALTLRESIADAPCKVRLKLRWRLEPFDPGCLVRLDSAFRLNGAATLNRHHWRSQIDKHCVGLMRAVAAELVRQGEAAVSGQTSGRSSMTVTKTTTVNGSPSLR